MMEYFYAIVIGNVIIRNDFYIKFRRIGMFYRNQIKSIRLLNESTFKGIIVQNKETCRGANYD